LLRRLSFFPRRAARQESWQFILARGFIDIDGKQGIWFDADLLQ